MISTLSNNIRAKYSFEEEIGDGMSSLIYRVFHSRKEYALKLFRKNKKFLFENELRIVQLLCTGEHPEFIRYITSSEADNITEENYIVYELAKKYSLEEFITPCMPFSELNVKVIVWKIAEFLKTLHNLGFCHRDLKLSNIFVDQNLHLKLGDFGSTKYFLNQNGESVLLFGVAGTPGYMAPEMAKKFPYDGQKVDIYSLGVILLYLTTGKTMSDKGEAISINEFLDKVLLEKENLNLTQDFKNLVTSMLDTNYQNRPNLNTFFNNAYFDEIRTPAQFQLAENNLRERLREIDSFNNPEI